MTMKPLLAATTSAEDIAALTFPLMWSPKLDGIRTLIHPNGPVSRTIKLLPNEKLRAFLAHPGLKNFDGEMLYGPITDKDVFNRTQSAVMKIEGPCPTEADGKYLVFDDFSLPDIPFELRYDNLTRRIKELPPEIQQVVKLVPHKLVHNLEDLMNVECVIVEKGYEGVMIRDPSGRYKFGRSTVRERILMKIKRFADEEATIIGVEELFHNENEAEKDAFGRTKRASHAENLVAGDTMGALVVKSDKFDNQFKIGTGFTAAQRQALWDDRDNLVGKTACFKYQPSGMKDVPRFPSFKGLRKD